MSDPSFLRKYAYKDARNRARKLTIGRISVYRVFGEITSKILEKGKEKGGEDQKVTSLLQPVGVLHKNTRDTLDFFDAKGDFV